MFLGNRLSRHPQPGFARLMQRRMDLLALKAWKIAARRFSFVVCQTANPISIDFGRARHGPTTIAPRWPSGTAFFAHAHRILRWEGGLDLSAHASARSNRKLGGNPHVSAPVGTSALYLWSISLASFPRQYRAPQDFASVFSNALRSGNCSVTSIRFERPYARTPGGPPMRTNRQYLHPVVDRWVLVFDAGCVRASYGVFQIPNARILTGPAPSSPWRIAIQNFAWCGIGDIRWILWHWQYVVVFSLLSTYG